MSSHDKNQRIGVASPLGSDHSTMSVDTDRERAELEDPAPKLEVFNNVKLADN